MSIGFRHMPSQASFFIKHTHTHTHTHKMGGERQQKSVMDPARAPRSQLLTPWRARHEGDASSEQNLPNYGIWGCVSNTLTRTQTVMRLTAKYPFGFKGASKTTSSANSFLPDFGLGRTVKSTSRSSRAIWNAFKSSLTA